MEKSLGIYIHIPFCASKCAYCDFYSEEDAPSRLAAVIAQLEKLNGKQLDIISAVAEGLAEANRK